MSEEMFEPELMAIEFQKQRECTDDECIFVGEGYRIAMHKYKAKIKKMEAKIKDMETEYQIKNITQAKETMKKLGYEEGIKDFLVRNQLFEAATWFRDSVKTTRHIDTLKSKINELKEDKKGLVDAVLKLAKGIIELENAILKHHMHHVNNMNYPIYGQADIDLWDNIKDKIKEGGR